jgi:hypothetical protein
MILFLDAWNPGTPIGIDEAIDKKCNIDGDTIQ